MSSLDKHIDTLTSLDRVTDEQLDWTMYLLHRVATATQLMMRHIDLAILSILRMLRYTLDYGMTGKNFCVARGKFFSTSLTLPHLACSYYRLHWDYVD